MASGFLAGGQFIEKLFVEFDRVDQETYDILHLSVMLPCLVKRDGQLEFNLKLKYPFEPAQEKMVLITQATSKGTGKPALSAVLSETSLFADM